MANKYSKYELQPFVSTYVDPQSVAVNTVLRERYDKNKASKDLIDRTLAQMQVMKGDQALIEDAKKEVKGLLNNVIEQGDYENATLAIQDAANHVDTDPGILAAKASYKNRLTELEYMREARLKGVQMLDFGKGAADDHVSYFYDENNEEFVTDVYEPMSEQMLDYDAEMSGLLKTIKADSKGNWEGITVGKADAVAAMMYGNYLTSDAGRQDFKRLVQLELPQDIPLAERERLAKKDIMKRLKGFTRQYVYSKVTAGKGEGGDNFGLPEGVLSSGTTSTKGITKDHPYTQSIQNLEILNDKTLSDEEKMAKIKFNQGMLDDSVKQFLLNQGPKGEQKLKSWEGLQKAHSQPGDAKFYELTRMLVTNTNKSSTNYANAINQAITRGYQGMIGGAVGGSTYGAVGGTFVVPGLGTAAGWFGGGLGGGLVGGGSGFIGGFGEGIAMEMDKFRNVRDWHRPSRADGQAWYEKGWDLVKDSEEEQLMQELFGSKNDAKMTVDKLNEALGTNYTEADIPRLKELSLSTYMWYASDEGGVTGDDVIQHIEDNGMALTASGYTTDGTKEGEAIQKTLDKTIIRSDPKQDWIIHGINTKDDYEDFLGENYELWNGGTITDVYEADPITNTPMRFQFRNKNGTSKIMELKPGGDLRGHTLSGLIFNTAKNLNMPNLRNQELIRQLLHENPSPTIGEYIDLQGQFQNASAGGTKETEQQYIRMIEDEYLLDIILDPSKQYARQFVQNNEGVLSLQHEGKLLPWIVNKSVNESVWALYQDMHPTMIAKLRGDLRSRSISEIAHRK